MISFNKPTNLNGEELRQELNAAGVAISDDTTSVAIDENGKLLLDIKESDKTKASSVVTAHNGSNTPKQVSLEDKLTSVGLSLSELKAALA